MQIFNEKLLESYREQLINEEKARATVQKYLHDARAFLVWLGDEELKKSAVLSYKNEIESAYAPASVNAIISSLNSFFMYMDRCELRVKSLKVQRQIFAISDKELSKSEYERLLLVAKKNKKERLWLLMQTICSCGIRVSEAKYITVEALRRGVANISCKGKHRQVFMAKPLCDILKRYAYDKKIKSGPIFVTKNGNPLDRSNIWSEMKKLCKKAGVSNSKVFPHNLRHLFARTYYGMQKDIVRLADILGHSSVNTTRIYTMESGEVHRKQMQKLGLILGVE